MDDKQYTELAVKVQEVYSMTKSNEHRIGELEVGMEKISDTQISLIKIANSVENMNISMTNVNKKVDIISDKQDKLNDKVTVLENKPAQDVKKRYETVISKVIEYVSIGFLGYLLAQILPKIF